MIYVPAAGAPDAILEAVGAGIKTIFCITEHIPALDMLRVVHVVDAGRRAPRRPQLPGRHVRRARPRWASSRATFTSPATLASCRRSGTLTYEVVEALTEAGIGQSTCVGIGGDPINGSNFIDILSSSATTPTLTRSC